MWQTITVLLLIAGGLIYIARHYVRVFRAETPGCSSCSGCSCSRTLQDSPFPSGDSPFASGKGNCSEIDHTPTRITREGE